MILWLSVTFIVGFLGYFLLTRKKKKLRDERYRFFEIWVHNFEKLQYEDLISKTAEFLSNEKAIGWFQGRMEFGPRALGNRSIIGDPRSDKMQKNLNLKVKYRESFRPFAPSILREDLTDWFNINVDSPYMLLVADVNSNKKIESLVFIPLELPC